MSFERGFGNKTHVYAREPQQFQSHLRYKYDEKNLGNTNDAYDNDDDGNDFNKFNVNFCNSADPDHLRESDDGHQNLLYKGHDNDGRQMRADIGGRRRSTVATSTTTDDIMYPSSRTRTETTATMPSTIDIDDRNEYFFEDGLEHTKDGHDIMEDPQYQPQYYQQHQQFHPSELLEHMYAEQCPFLEFTGVVLSVQYIAPSRILGASAAHIRSHCDNTFVPININDSNGNGPIREAGGRKEDDVVQPSVMIETAEFREEGGTADFAILGRIILNLRPMIIILPNGIHASVFDKLEGIRQLDVSNDWYWQKMLVSVQDAAPFNFDRAMRRISFLNGGTKNSIHNMVPGVTGGGRGGSGGISPIDASKKQLCRSLGGLLTYLDRWNNQKTFAAEVDHSEAAAAAGKFVIVESVHPMFPRGILHINANTAAAMSIFESEFHPSRMGLGTIKEGLSLFGMYQSFCSSCIGKQAMKAWMQNPLDDIVMIERRLAAVSYFVEFHRTTDMLSQLIEPVADVVTLIRRFGYVILFRLFLYLFRCLRLLPDKITIITIT